MSNPADRGDSPDRVNSRTDIHGVLKDEVQATAGFSTVDDLLRELLSEEDDEHLAYEQLAAYVDRSLPPEMREAVEKHAAVCASCSSDLGSLSQVAAQLSLHLLTDVAPEEVGRAAELPSEPRRRLVSLLGFRSRQGSAAVRWRPRYAFSVAFATAATTAMLLFVSSRGPQNTVSAPAEAPAPPQASARDDAAAPLAAPVTARTDEQRPLPNQLVIPIGRAGSREPEARNEVVIPSNVQAVTLSLLLDGDGYAGGYEATIQTAGGVVVGRSSSVLRAARDNGRTIVNWDLPASWLSTKSEYRIRLRGRTTAEGPLSRASATLDSIVDYKIVARPGGLSEVRAARARDVVNFLREFREMRAREYANLLSQCREVTSARYPFEAGSRNDVPLTEFARLFGYGGAFERFFENVRDSIDLSRSPWSLRNGGEAFLSPLLTSSALNLLETARRIRDAFFRPLSPNPAWRVQATPWPGDAATLIRLELDGQWLVDYQRQEINSRPPLLGLGRRNTSTPAGRKESVVWPGPEPGETAVTFQVNGGPVTTSTFEGPWAWFRLIDGAPIYAESYSRYVLVFDAGRVHRRVDSREAESRQVRVRIDDPPPSLPFSPRVPADGSIEPYWKLLLRNVDCEGGPVAGQ